MTTPTVLPSALAEQAAPTPISLPHREAARAIGVSPRTLWQMAKDNRIPCVRLGTGRRKKTVYPVALLQDWLAEQAAAQSASAK